MIDHSRQINSDDSNQGNLDIVSRCYSNIAHTQKFKLKTPKLKIPQQKQNKNRKRFTTEIILIKAEFDSFEWRLVALDWHRPLNHSFIKLRWIMVERTKKCEIFILFSSTTNTPLECRRTTI